ncbi:LOW QUALITY PROTEIN: hypothetical protein BC938DRAFT_475376, partial [Jimgerdemannia flammicorona]
GELCPGQLRGAQERIQITLLSNALHFHPTRPVVQICGVLRTLFRKKISLRLLFPPKTQQSPSLQRTKTPSLSLGGCPLNLSRMIAFPRPDIFFDFGSGMFRGSCYGEAGSNGPAVQRPSGLEISEFSGGLASDVGASWACLVTKLAYTHLFPSCPPFQMKQSGKVFWTPFIHRHFDTLARHTSRSSPSCRASSSRSQIQSKFRENRLAELTKRELDGLEPGTKTYRPVGKMFIQTPLQEMQTLFTEKIAKIDEDTKALEKTQKYWERAASDAQGNLRDILGGPRRM